MLQWWRHAAELAGFALLAVAAWEVHPVAGLVAAGSVLLLYGNGGK